MAVAGRSTTGAEGVASTLREAGFVRLLVAADADALAAAGLLADALSALGVPFHASIHAERPSAKATDDATTIRIGSDGPAALSLTASDEPASDTAFAACRALGTHPDPVLALVGAFVAGETSDFEASDAFETARERELIEQRPGVAVPVADIADGLCHTTLAHTEFSGDSEATAAALDGFDPDADRRRVASVLALSVCQNSTPRAAEVVKRALKPYAVTDRGRDDATVTGRFVTVGGFADVLRASAREHPGVGLALALGHDVCEAALAAWRTHAERAHAALRKATTERHRNLFVARVDAGTALPTAARLLCDFRSPEPVAVVVGETRAAAAARDDSRLGERMATAGEAAEGNGDGDVRRGWARFENPDEFVSALREAVA